MFRTILSVSAILLATASAISAQESTTETTQSEEAIIWDAIKDSDASADVFAFIEQYPNGEFTKEAQALMIDLLWAEMAAVSPVTVIEEPTSEDIVAITFSAPLTEGAPEIVGKSLEELIVGSPLFPPVEGLPESYWKTQECSNCHEWEQANLCVQANTYLTDAGAENLTKQHPYGGTFKQNLQSWAMTGCE
jgi:hypothetical protein